MEALLKSAETGDDFAQYAIGYFYLFDKYSKNVDRAEKWLGRSAEQGNKYAEALLEIMRKQMADQARTYCMRLMKHINKMIESDYNRQKEYVAVADKKLMRTILEKKEALGQKI